LTLRLHYFTIVPPVQTLAKRMLSASTSLCCQCSRNAWMCF